MLLELPYLPPVSWCARAFSIVPGEILTLEACENYQKGTWRNRFQIVGPNGPQRLTVPLRKGKNQQQNIRKVEIAYDEPWQQVHWRSIEAAYGNAPFFIHYAPVLRPLFEERFRYLFDLNFELLTVVFGKMKFPRVFETSKIYVPKGQKPDDFRDAVSPKIAAPDWFLPVRYPQVFEERHSFLPDLSVLDLLFCCGNTAGEILQKSMTTNAY